MVIIQKIHVEWDKESRGEPGATRRNAVPKSLPISSTEGHFVFEECHFSQFTGFNPKLFQPSLAGEQIPERIANLVLAFQNDQLVVGFHWDDRVGKPGRHNKSLALNLRVGMYGRLIVNGRHKHYEYSWDWYTQDIYNIAFVDQITREFFTSREPDQLCDLRADLF